MCLSALPNWFQAIAALVMVALTGLTLSVLRTYAKDTKRLADDTSSQVERSQMPYLTFTVPTNLGQTFLVNQGYGPALNIEVYRHVSGATLDPEFYSSFAVGDGQPIARRPSLIKYQSLSGKKYETEVMEEAGRLKIVFRKIE